MKSPLVRIGFRIGFGLLMLATLWRCGSATQEASQGIILTDDLGQVMEQPGPPKRILALTPALTEMLYAVADTAQIVGVTVHCDYPEAVRYKRRISLMPLDIEGIVALKPDLVFSEATMTAPDDLNRLRQLGIRVYQQRYDSVADVIRGMGDIARILERSVQNKPLLDSLRQELRSWEEQATRRDTTPSALVMIWTDPIYVFGRNTLMNDKLRLAGLRNALDTVLGQPHPQLSREWLLRLNPDILFYPHPEQLETVFLSRYPEQRQLKAIRQGRVYSLDDNLASRPGPRVLEGVREIFTKSR